MNTTDMLIAMMNDDLIKACEELDKVRKEFEITKNIAHRLIGNLENLDKEEARFVAVLTDKEHTWYECPECARILSAGQKYCSDCGIKLDWTDSGVINLKEERW